MGISVAPEIFHHLVVDALAEVPDLKIFIDDIMVHGKLLDKHNARLQQILLRLKQVSITPKQKKSVVGKERVDFFGHRLTATGIQPQ